MSVRLQKAIADAGITSRRKAETLIESGRVFLNDKKAKLGDKFLSGDKIFIDGKEIKFNLSIEYHQSSNFFKLTPSFFKTSYSL